VSPGELVNLNLTIRVPHPLPPANQRLMDSLGVRVVIDPKAPAQCPCGCRNADRINRRDR
jgi:hypothetical protein